MHEDTFARGVTFARVTFLNDIKKEKITTKLI